MSLAISIIGYRVKSVPNFCWKHLCCRGSLERSKSQEPRHIFPQQEVDRMITKPTDAVEKHDALR
jgi:hypothetical protein